MARAKSNTLMELAKLGARARLLELEKERQAILRSFPGIEKAADVPEPPRRNYRMSARTRKAVSQRMKRYWAERRKERVKR